MTSNANLASIFLGVNVRIGNLRTSWQGSTESKFLKMKDWLSNKFLLFLILNCWLNETGGRGGISR